MFILILQRLLLEALLDLLYFPLWWYTGGIKYALANIYNVFQSGNLTLAPGLWLKNIFVPMFGQYDWQGRIISFFMRLANVIGRFFALLIWGVFCLGLLFIWFAIPLVIAYGLFFGAGK